VAVLDNFVKNSCTEFHENSRRGLVASDEGPDGRSILILGTGQGFRERTRRSSHSVLTIPNLLEFSSEWYTHRHVCTEGQFTLPTSLFFMMSCRFTRGRKGQERSSDRDSDSDCLRECDAVSRF
jgi:hypothetical protein